MRLRSGFTLVEISIVLVIVALITGMGFVATLGAVESARRASTESKLNAIEKALMEFRETHDRLPCPGQPDLVSSNELFGIEGSPPGNCQNGTPGAPYAGTVPVGDVPVRTLGLPNEFAFDGWGRKISYTVAPNMTSYKIFSAMHPQETCGMEVVGESGDIRSADNAVYTLVSHGPNGHGAYLGNGSRMNSRSVNVDELYNCRCDTSTAWQNFVTTVQKEPTGEVSSTSAFDDIVRYKERWQLLTEEDSRTWDGPITDNLTVGFDSDDAAVAYKRQCHALVQNQIVGNTAGGNSVSQVAYTADNKHVVLLSGSSNCESWTVNTITYEEDAGAISSCPTFDSEGRLVITNNDYMFVSNTTGFTDAEITKTIYLAMWKFDKTSETYTYVPLTFPNRTVPLGGAVTALGSFTELAVSRNGEFVVTGVTGGSWVMYRRMNENQLVQLSTQPAFESSAYRVKFSADGRIMAQTHDATQNMTVWRRTGENTFTQLTDPDFTGLSTVPLSLAISDDGKFLAGAAFKAGTINEIFRIYKIDFDSANTAYYTPVTIVNEFDAYGPSSGVYDMTFSSDAKYLYAIERDGSDRCGIFTFVRSGPTEYTYQECSADQIPSGAILRSLAVPH
jgi:prepilin-type N-terminal cleavage/methylation domain-containing protein